MTGATVGLIGLADLILVGVFAAVFLAARRVRMRAELETMTKLSSSRLHETKPQTNVDTP
jgi:hypothetical protein